MNKINSGGPAFPTAERRSLDGILNAEATDGMSFRDYAAVEAMKALIKAHGDVNRITDSDGWVSLHYRAYEHADLMIEQRKK
jgi:hypothetical protein